MAIFAEADTSDGTSEFSASINWGDGINGSGTVQKIANGLFQVVPSASHTYSVTPTGGLLISVSQDWTTAVPVWEGQIILPRGGLDPFKYNPPPNNFKIPQNPNLQPPTPVALDVKPENAGIAGWLSTLLGGFYKAVIDGQHNLVPLQWEKKSSIGLWGGSIKLGWSVKLSGQANLTDNEASIRVSGSLFAEASDWPLNLIPLLQFVPPNIKGVVAIKGGISGKVTLGKDAKFIGGSLSFNAVSLTLGARSSTPDIGVKVYGELGVVIGPLSFEILPKVAAAKFQVYGYLRVGLEFGWGDSLKGWKRAWDYRFGLSLNLD